jgi:hypothetical protein
MWVGADFSSRRDGRKKGRKVGPGTGAVTRRSRLTRKAKRRAMDKLSFSDFAEADKAEFRCQAMLTNGSGPVVPSVLL